MVEGELTSNFHYFILTYLAKLHDTKAETIGTYLVLEEVLGLSVGEGDEPPGDSGDGGEERRRGDRPHRVDAPEQPDRDEQRSGRIVFNRKRVSGFV